MSDLPRSLAEAAWSEMAGPAWRNVTYADLSEADPDTVMSSMKTRVDHTVAAVLETLAARSTDAKTREQLIALAAEVKSEEDET